MEELEARAGRGWGGGGGGGVESSEQREEDGGKFAEGRLKTEGVTRVGGRETCKQSSLQ